MSPDVTGLALIYREARYERQVLAHKVADLLRAGYTAEAYALARTNYATACQMCDAAMDKWQAALDEAS